MKQSAAIHDLPRKPYTVSLMYTVTMCEDSIIFIHFIHSFDPSAGVIIITRQAPITIIISKNNTFMQQ